MCVVFQRGPDGLRMFILKSYVLTVAFSTMLFYAPKWFDSNTSPYAGIEQNNMIAKKVRISYKSKCDV